MTAATWAAPVAPQRPSAELDHLSWSSIQSNTTCPRKFAYRYVEAVPEEFTASSLPFGSAFHAALVFIHQSRIKGLPAPETTAVMGRYSSAWNSCTTDLPVQFAKGEDSVSLHDTARRMLAAYLEHLAPQQAGTVIAITV